MSFWSLNRNKEFPDFWKNYLALFENQPSKRIIEAVRFVAFDTETTGFDYSNDRILSIGCVAINNVAIDVADQLELYLEQDVFNSNTVEIHGIRKNNNFDTILEFKAIELFLEYIGNAILIAHHADFDKKMINSALKRHGLGTLKNKFLDTGVLFRKTKHLVYRSNRKHVQYALDELCDDLKISKSDRHTASGDAFITALAFLKIIPKLKIHKTDKVSNLF
ncbi:DNA polymerase-3 subunit epsilon [Aquimarina amphilecti]|uniref:DNA polymerase-3 subunit epsilon n=1 Tax=Aquimarina amphilecti TaxID=1038014 RepID=A0A1H7NMK1_AQUAM|nr:3'-5' exonuclease [Aquimarina amphilecti]SEL24621.1 DNA polymerase-3 subunit epsilon [Aquimarina amphilecti]